MIDVRQIELILLFQTKQQFNQNNFAWIKDEVENYLYPLGIIPINAITNNAAYDDAEFINTYQYFEEITSYFFENIYTTEELDIINAYLMVCTFEHLIFENNVLQFLNPYLNKTSNKAEIQYCIDEIKYAYLSSLVYSESDDNNLINSLIAELKPIEINHNSFNMYEKIK